MAIFYVPPQSSGGVSDYNDLINTPIKDTRKVTDYNFTFDGNLEGREIVTEEMLDDVLSREEYSLPTPYVTVGETVFVKISDKLPKLDEILNHAINLKLYYNGNSMNGVLDSVNDSYEVNENISIVSQYCLIIYNDFDGISKGVYVLCINEDSMCMYVSELSYSINDGGELIKLDEKYLNNNMTLGSRGELTPNPNYTQDDIDNAHSLVVGKSNTAIMNSVATGMFCHAESEYSLAHGVGCRTASSCSHAEGGYCTTLGYGCHAEGYNTQAKGYYTHSEGYNTISNGEYQHTSGCYNIEDEEGRYLTIVGNGKNEWINGTPTDVRSNAYTLDKQGNGWFAKDVYVGGTSQDDAKKLLSTSDIYFDADGNLVITINGVTKKFSPIE